MCASSEWFNPPLANPSQGKHFFGVDFFLHEEICYPVVRVLGSHHQEKGRSEKN